MNSDFKNNVKISASLMCIDWLNAEKEIDILFKQKIDLLHIDVIDGRYAPDYTMGTSIINCFRESFNRPFDYHLMVEEPSRIFDTFDIRKGDRFCFCYFLRTIWIYGLDDCNSFIFDFISNSNN